jgi:hypothetical protein
MNVSELCVLFWPVTALDVAEAEPPLIVRGSRDEMKAHLSGQLSRAEEEVSLGYLFLSSEQNGRCEEIHILQKMGGISFFSFYS